jgi:phosphatidylserine/phosphatidylglycerophosphate/cardiolipin synthase-like enzyme
VFQVQLVFWNWQGGMDASAFDPERGGAMRRQSPIVKVGINAWRSAKADKVGFLIDAAEYYAGLDTAFRQAKKTVWIVGWDFNPDIYLRPDRPAEPLGELLRSLVEKNPDLEIRILVWAMGPIYSGKSLSLFNEHTWSLHPRIHLRFDSKHPLRGSHHQKLVCIVDAIAFIGGIDLTARRWDTCEHRAVDPLRVSPDGEPYEPVHDLQAALSGNAARMIGDLARRRWQHATGEAIVAVEPRQDIWPAHIETALGNCDIALALTEPGFLGRRSRREAARLTIDALAAAKRHIYIETQYLAHFGIARVLERRLAEPDGPEIVVVVTRISHGLLEKLMMGGNRNRLIRRLRRADRFNRFRALYPVVPSSEGREQDIMVHSKLLVIDDDFVRLGSSNLNNRSEGLDTESDIAIEARDDDCRLAIAHLRDRLVAEHVEAGPEAVAQALAREGSLIAAIDRLNMRPRGLRALDVPVGAGTEPVWGTALIDPKKPYWPLQKLRDQLDALASRLLGIFM